MSDELSARSVSDVSVSVNINQVPKSECIETCNIGTVVPNSQVEKPEKNRQNDEKSGKIRQIPENPEKITHSRLREIGGQLTILGS